MSKTKQFLVNSMAKAIYKKYKRMVEKEEKQGKITFKNDKERNSYIVELIRRDYARK